MSTEQLAKDQLQDYAVVNSNPFIANTAKDYDLSYQAVETIYNRYGGTAMFYEKLEELLNQQE